MPVPQTAATPSAQASRLTNCPDCQSGLAVLRIIPGRAGAEYWTMRCTKCGGIHLDIVKASEVTGSDDLRA
jgi:Zn finger protein HypA/HybF involved in hydrogenase expression